MNHLWYYCSGCKITAASLPFLLRMRNLLDLSIARTDIQTVDLTTSPVQQSSISSLDVSYCKNMDFSVVDLIVNACPHMHTLNLSGCSELDDLAIFAISQNFPKLHTLNISKMPQITDKAIEHISMLRHLQYLNASGCFQITDYGVTLLLNQLALLQTLHLTDCPKVTYVGSLINAKHVPSLQLLGMGLFWCFVGLSSFADPFLQLLLALAFNLMKLKSCKIVCLYCNYIMSQGIQSNKKEVSMLTMVQIPNREK